MSRKQTHLHYADYQDSHWWTGSPTDGAGIWIRDPILDGDVSNGVDNAMELLDQARKEVQAVQNMFGTDPAGTRTTLKDRLAYRVSPSGIRRGGVVSLRGPNATVGSGSTVHDWYEGGSIYWQLFRFQAATAGLGLVTATYNRSYFTSLEPDLVIVQMDRAGNELLGSVQIQPSTITVNSFKFTARTFDSNRNWGAPGGRPFYTCLAVGGFPSA